MAQPKPIHTRPKSLAIYDCDTPCNTPERSSKGTESAAMATLHRSSDRLLPIFLAQQCLQNVTNAPFQATPLAPLRRIARMPIFISGHSEPASASTSNFTPRRTHSASVSPVRVGWLMGFGDVKKNLPEIVKAGDPVLHEPARDVEPEEIGSDRIQKIIDDMIQVMRKAPGVGLAAPQIGIPLRIIVLEDTKEYISYGTKEEAKAQDRHPFDLLVILNPKLEKKGDKTALFFEGCLSVDGFRALVERYLQVEVAGFDRNGQAIKFAASGWQARILQHECDHLDGTLFVDKMVPRTFRTVDNLDLPLPIGIPRLGVR